jgi:uncharacterized protein (TIGR03492 family)
MKLLCVSNGHGEDAIALRILQQLLRHPNAPQVAALPIVGEGQAYQAQGIPIIGTVKKMPSGGFIYMDGRQLARDLQGGLLQLLLEQFKTVRNWAKQGGVVLAVGDIVPLLLANLSGANYAFVGTAQSEYYLRNESGWLPRQSRFDDWLKKWFGSVYYPWERWLMSHPRCKAVFPRDPLTTKTLQQWLIPAFDMGNPMMDDLEPSIPKPIFYPELEKLEKDRLLTITLLPGSRTPEAYQNWQNILQAVSGIIEAFGRRQVLFLAAIAPTLNLDFLRQSLVSQGFVAQSTDTASRWKIPDGEALVFTQDKATVILTQHAYNDCLHRGDIAIAMAGTATEQFIGLGKPAIAIPGNGPQFTKAFAEAQSRLLGPSLILVEQPHQVANIIQTLLRDPDRLQQIAENGIRRMGKPGAACRIADYLIQKLAHG